MASNGSEKRLVISIPTYNEATNIEGIYNSLREISSSADFLFIDDNSPDGTGNLIKQICEKDNKVFLHERPKKLGVGSAHIYAIKWAYDNGYDNLLTLDADFTHTAKAVKNILDLSESNEGIIVGSRFIDKNSLPGWTFYRKFMTHYGHFLTKFLLGIPYDATGSLRLYNLKAISYQVLSLVKSGGYAFFPESMFVLSNNNIKIKEVPVTLPSRTYGNSKMTIKEVLKTVRLLMTISLRNWLYPNTYYYVNQDQISNSKETSETCWDSYWKENATSGKVWYDVFAKFTRNILIKPRLISILKKNFKLNSELLHIGSGSGELDKDIIEYAKITALDYSNDAHIRYISSNKEKSNCVIGDAFNLPFEDETFDGVYHLGLYEHYSDQDVKKMLSEVFRVLKKNGKVLIFWPPKYGSSVLFFKILKFFGKKTDACLYPAEINLLKNKEHVRKVFDDTGFKLKKISFSIWDMFLQVGIVAEK